jgi:hypothetical protein
MERIDALTSNDTEASGTANAFYVPNQELQQKLLKDAPLLAKEDKELYQKIFEGALLDLQPQSLLEWLSVRDIVDKRFEERRYQRLKLELLDHAKRPPPIATDYDEGRALVNVQKCLPHLETLSRMETNCASFRRTAMKEVSPTVQEKGNSPSVVPD